RIIVFIVRSPLLVRAERGTCAIPAWYYGTCSAFCADPKRGSNDENYDPDAGRRARYRRRHGLTEPWGARLADLPVPAQPELGRQQLTPPRREAERPAHTAGLFRFRRWMLFPPQ